VTLGNKYGGGTSPGTVATQGLSNFSLGRQNGDLGFGGFVFSAQSDAVSVLLRALRPGEQSMY
jgi:general secretion pathway protein D